jgi:uncharacterized delta-60 repeat protein
MASQITRLITTLGLLLLGATPAWAGRGDIDPNYGEGGRLFVGGDGTVFPLTGDRLLISNMYLYDSGVRDLRMVDATGQLVQSFGDGGVLVIDSTARAQPFQASAAALAPNGDIVFLGEFLGGQTYDPKQTLLRVDSNGQPVPSFGTDGDGFIVLNITTTARVITIDPDGRIVLVEGSVDADNNCVTTARLQRLLADGQPDAAFGGDGLVEIPELNTCYGTTVFGARADGSVIVGDDDSTIVAVDAAGDIDPAFGTDGRFQVAGLASAKSLLLPDGSLLVFGSSTDAGASDTVFGKYDRNGQPDLAFGSGSGSVTVDLGTAFLGEPSAREVIDQLALDPDGEHVIAELSLFHADESLACSGIARLAIDGTPDATFGRNGLTCLNFYSAVIAVQGDGAPLVFLGYQDFIGRLLPDNTPSPGLLRATSGRVDVNESAGTATLAIERLAGRDGAVSASFTTTDRRVRHCNYYYRTCWFSDGAAAGSDYTFTSGHLDWGDADDGKLTITVSILDDAIQENAETFGVDISEPDGGVLLIVGSPTLYINDNDTARTPPPQDDDPVTSGGGGSMSWPALLALLALLFVRPRRERRAGARTAALPGLLLLVSTAAWASRGDIDPNYGEDGGVSILDDSVLLALPNDRLVIAAATGQGFGVRMVDAAGKSVAAFGEGGVVIVDSSDAARAFWPEVATVALNGDMIFLGSRQDTGARELLRLDSDGQPVSSFGDRGDGFAEPVLASAMMAIDPDGKIVLAEGSWNANSTGCEGDARLQRLLVDGQPDTGFGGDGIVEIPDLDICGGAFVFGTRTDGSVVVGNDQAIIAINSAGDVDPTFGVDGRLTLTTELANLAWPRGRLLPDGGLLIFATIGESPSSNDTVFLKFDRNGQPDPDFGVSGSLTVDLGADLLGEPFDWEFIDPPALDPDGEHIIAKFGLKRAADGSIACSGIARLTIDGTPDTGFGRNGLTCLNFDYSLIAVQSTGAPLFLAGYDNAIHRLLPDNSPSPGLLKVHASYVHVNESDGTAIVSVERLAGRDGAVSIDHTTSARPRYFARGHCNGCGFWVDSATAGSDYTATSGRLDWASGDDSQQTVNVKIDRDQRAENLETFGVDFFEPVGGAPLIGSSTTVMIHDNEQTTSDDDATSSGGGGSVSWATALALLSLLLLRQRELGRLTSRNGLH